MPPLTWDSYYAESPWKKQSHGMSMSSHVPGEKGSFQGSELCALLCIPEAERECPVQR